VLAAKDIAPSPELGRALPGAFSLIENAARLACEMDFWEVKIV
jgi:hypothetical protein